MTRTQYAKKFTPEQRAEYLKAQRDKAAEELTKAVSQLQSTAGFRKWLEARARFHKYSFNNVLLIMVQTMGKATRVAAASVWRELGRHPQKGSTALRIFAPIDIWVECEQGTEGARYNDKRKRFEVKRQAFKLVPVFDIAQTEGDELPAPPMPASVDGDSHSHLVKPLTKLARSLGYKVSTETLTDGSQGYCDHIAKRIVTNTTLSPNGTVHVLVHEIAHALGIGYKDYTRAMAEVLVESVTFIVLAGQNFDVKAASVPYVANWAGKGDTSAALEKFAATVDEVARKIEAVL